MAKFCPSCGKSIEDNAQFCDGCGAVQPGAETAQQTAGQPVPAPVINQDGYAADDIEKNKVIAALAYLGILFFLPLVAAPESKYGRYHANQGLLLLITAVAGGIVLAILSAILTAISWHLFFIGSLLYTVFYIGITVLVILGIVNAVGGKAKPLPVIGKLFTIIK